VENDQEVRNLIVPFLGSLGYRVLLAHDAVDALQQFENQTPRLDLLIADVAMPRMNGKSLIELLTPKLPSLKALYMSASAHEAMTQDDPLETREWFLEKPCQPDVLAMKVRTVLDAPKTKD
jgi:CheY-like chemotaxis protein